jgi:predicted O-linked N-acetylglucosamine transferase (SPINDLY family)
LWLLADNVWAQENMRREALNMGVDESRLVFASRATPENYLARYEIADLFLDSYPFNGGTTANDALWMGLPVLTRAGQTFASRMAGALLTAARLPELITFDLPGYEAQAKALARNPERCRALREHLREVRRSGVLFDTPRFVRQLEERLLTLPST